MRAEKKLLTSEYVARLNASPFFIVVGYQGLKVAHLTELRKRLTQAGAEIHVVKNTVFSVAAKEAGIGELNGCAGRPACRRDRQEGHFRRRQGAEKFRRGIRQAEIQVRLSEQPAARRGVHHGARGFAEPRRAPRQAARPVQRAGDEAGDFDQHAGHACWRRSSRPRPKKANKQFPA